MSESYERKRGRLSRGVTRTMAQFWRLVLSGILASVAAPVAYIVSFALIVFPVLEPLVLGLTGNIAIAVLFCAPPFICARSLSDWAGVSSRWLDGVLFGGISVAWFFWSAWAAPPAGYDAPIGYFAMFQFPTSGMAVGLPGEIPLEIANSESYYDGRPFEDVARLALATALAGFAGGFVSRIARSPE